jgi:hypothetical protein
VRASTQGVALADPEENAVDHRRASRRLDGDHARALAVSMKPICSISSNAFHMPMSPVPPPSGRR